jgi:Ser/Thr protein kinase RdoA (MazF antagonist)
MNNRSTGAIAAALVVARAQGVVCHEPVVLRDAWHILLHLQPSPVVVRVSAPPEPGGPKADDVVRELAVAGHAARRGAPVVPPAPHIDPGPHWHDGHVVTFWEYVESHGEVDASAAAHALREIHDALADYEDPLPAAGHPAELEEMLATLGASEDAALLREVAAAAPQLEGQALHGDAHLFNCLRTDDGPLWHDFETACRGPREYDLAALFLRALTQDDRASREALPAYGEHDEELLAAAIPVYAAWVFASMLVAVPRRPELAPMLQTRLRWLRNYVRE